MISLHEEDGFAAACEIGFKKAAMTFFPTPRRCESEQQTEQQDYLT